MSQSNHSALLRKKLAKPASAASPLNSNHKLMKIPSSSTYVVDNIDEEPDHMLSVPSRSMGPAFDFEKAYACRNHKKIDKTTSSMNVINRGAWNDSKKLSAPCMAHSSVIREESELIGVLTKQLYLAEVQIHKLQSTVKKNDTQIKAKDQDIDRLKRKVKDWENKNKSLEALRKKEQQQRRRQIEQSEGLYKRCLALENRIFEMEKFLADYGLVWVGDTTGNVKSPEVDESNYIENYYEQIAANIEQLNLAAGKGEVQVHHSDKGATFKTTSCMSLKFYKNGIIVGGSALRPYSNPNTVSFLRDILDGYYPSELQQTYPNGVPFKVEDHRNQTYIGESAGFPGHGYRLGKQVPPDSVSLSMSSRRNSNTSQRTARRMSLTKESSHAEFSEPFLTGSPRSIKQKNTPESPPMDMYVLRSQILASHNNICSDTHLQSHINAELNNSPRKEKQQRDAGPKPVDHDPMRERPIRPKTAIRYPSTGRCYHSSTDRVSSRVSPNRFDVMKDAPRQRSRSASLSRSRPTPIQKPTPRTKPGPEPKGGFEATRSPYYPLSRSTPSTRCSSSAPQHRNVAVRKASTPLLIKPTGKRLENMDVVLQPPVLHQINEPSGRDGELRLKVRSLNGGTVYLVHASADDTVARLYQLLDKAMLRSVPRGYKVVLSGYAPRRLEHLAMSLRESGITRDSVLHLVND